MLMKTKHMLMLRERTVHQNLSTKIANKSFGGGGCVETSNIWERHQRFKSEFTKKKKLRANEIRAMPATIRLGTFVLPI
jgi:hypothetical protein